MPRQNLSIHFCTFTMLLRCSFDRVKPRGASLENWGTPYKTQVKLGCKDWSTNQAKEN